MKFTTKSISILFVSAVVLLSVGCSDFLKEEDPSNIAPGTFFTEPEHAQAAVLELYENLRFHDDGAGIFSANFQMIDALSGTCGTETGQNSDLNNLYNQQLTGDNLHLTQWWRQLYEGVGNANLAIARIPEIPLMPEADKTKWLGHARFMRALHYFWLVQLWGDVPLLTEPIYTYTSPDVTPTRSTKEEVYALIEQDLLAAEQAGFPDLDASGLASRTAVRSLLAKVYLTQAGFPLRKQGYYQKAADKAKEVIDYSAAHPAELNLFDSLGYLHDLTKENVVEHIFEIQYAAGVANSDYQAYFLPNNTNITASGEVGTTVPTAKFLDSFEPGDRRMEEKEFFFKRYGTGKGDTLGRLYVYKLYDVVANGLIGVKNSTSGSGNAGINYPILRYADVLLMYAEAQNEATGPSVAVFDALNAVRVRSHLTPVAGLSQADLRNAIWRERWHELCFENQTWYDMIRTRKIYDEAHDTFVDFIGGTLGTGVKLEEKNLLLPLPAGDYRNNPNLRPNNPGY